MAQVKRESITRRGILSALTLLPAAAALAAPDGAAAPSALPAPSPPDPIFAAIEAHARACAALEGFAETLAEAEQTAWHAPRGKRRAANRRLKESYEAQGRLCDALSESTGHFAATVPGTLAGAAAALVYVREHYDRGYPVCEEEEFITLIGSTEQAIRRALDTGQNARA
jgi:hypothetical protein